MAGDPSAGGEPQSAGRLSRTAKGQQIEELAKLGYDVTEGRSRGAVTVVATPTQASKLRRAGFKPSFVRDRKGRTVRQVAAAQAAAGYDVFRPFGAGLQQGGPAGGQPSHRAGEARGGAPGHHQEGGHRPLDQGPADHRAEGDQGRAQDQGRQPADGPLLRTQHAREWIATEVDRRLLHYYVDNYAKNTTDGKVVTPLVNKRELWFVIVCNPDGYDYTFQSADTRLWRKNLRDVNGDGQITNGDGVDPNRNWPSKWNYDNEGSSSDPASETYRGTGPASEPETKALDGLMKRIKPVMLNNYHSFAQLLLYPIGWQWRRPRRTTRCSWR